MRSRVRYVLVVALLPGFLTFVIASLRDWGTELLTPAMKPANSPSCVSYTTSETPTGKDSSPNGLGDTPFDTYPSLQRTSYLPQDLPPRRTHLTQPPPTHLSTSTLPAAIPSRSHPNSPTPSSSTPTSTTTTSTRSSHRWTSAY
jgi:hypothetical protein